jgi:hypothetical protein
MSENQIKQLEKQYKLKLKLHNNIIFVETKFDNWYIEQDGKIKLYHQNKCYIKKHYHEHDTKDFNNIYEVLSYISKHDFYYQDKRGSLPSRLDCLYNQIEQSSKKSKSRI